MRIAVKDTSILIDLAEGDLLAPWFSLRIESHATDLVLAELHPGDGWRHVSRFVQTGQLRRHSHSPAALIEVASYSQTRGLSMADASGILLALRLEALLLTGDRRMRGVAEGEGVPVRGLLWILDRLVEARLLAPRIAADRLERLGTAGSRLPPAACAERLRTWRS